MPRGISAPLSYGRSLLESAHPLTIVVNIAFTAPKAESSNLAQAAEKGTSGGRVGPETTQHEQLD